ncbi:MAG TPA: DNA gyrase inhibitor YacG [Parvularculaceae bacterium]|nr:DNA gyrase inhibitor YacG [Caulobacterales bacterium]HPE30214.1 DNA gyrase inhibitor YacG [Parvularculaceae bacterium]HRX39209.1 DNA gyrase inhibitor YacG [Parvularculaceae bacterium]
MSPKSDKPAPQPGAKAAECPICGKPAAPDYAPFCSKRCADIDLHRWLSGSYAIPAVEDDGDIDDGGEGE